MISEFVYKKIAPLMSRWFAENYGRHLIEEFASEAGKCEVVLDLGAGTGNDLAIVKKLFPAAQYWAIESYPPNIEKLSNAGISVVSLDIEKDQLPYDSGTVDLIIINQVLEHTKNVFWIMHECSRILKKNGTIIVGVPNLAAWHNRLLLLLGIQPPAIASVSCHVRGFTQGDLSELINGASGGALKVVRVRSAGFYPFPPSVARGLARLFPKLGWSIHLSASKVRNYDGHYLATAKSLNETNFYVGPK